MSDTEVMNVLNVDENTSLTDSQVIKFRDVPNTVHQPSSTEHGGTVSVIGETLHFTGELSADEDLIIEGTVEGKINQGKCCLTVKPKGRLIANVNATKIFIEGKVTGDLHATVSVKLREGSEVLGDIVSPTVSLEDGATFNGNIKMQSPSDPAPR